MANLFSIRSDLYRAVATVRSKEETRYYLCGVHIEPHPVEGVFLVATDGHRMLVAHDAAGSCSEAVTVKIDGAALKAGKTKRSDGPYRRRFRADSPLAVTIVSQDGDVTATCDWRVDGSFPDWRRVLPTGKPSGKVAGFNPHYLADFAKVADELGIEKPCVTVAVESGDGGALVTFNDDDIFGVIMPIKGALVGFPYFMNPKYRASGEAA